MNNSLDSIEKVLMENEIDTIAALRIATNGVEIRIKNNYRADTIDMELGKKMDAYKVMRRSLGPLSKAFNDIKIGIDDQRITLGKLKNDIENGNGDRSKYEEYTTFEDQKVQQLNSLLTEYVKEKTKTMTEFHRLHQEMYDFSISLLNNKTQIKTKK
jgi:hypothetical protein